MTMNQTFGLGREKRTRMRVFGYKKAKELIRTQYEHFYLVPDIHIHCNTKYPINLIKIALLNFFTFFNKPVVKQYGLNTNDYLIGVGYTSMMNSLAISSWDLPGT